MSFMNQQPCSRDSCSSSSSSSSMSSTFRPSKLIQPAPPHEFVYPVPPFHAEENINSSPLAYNKVSSPTSYSYSRFGNNDPAQEIGWDGGDFESKDRRPYMIRWKSGKKVDQRLLMLLESYFQELYVKRRDFFEKIFPGNHDEFSVVFSKIEDMFSKNNDEVKSRTLRRSLSVGSRRPRPQRFKVKTPAVVIGNLDGQGTAGPAEAATSKK